MHALDMENIEVLKAARTQLECELSLEYVNGIEDLPADNLLYQLLLFHLPPSLVE